jgi:ABC-type Fe3+ transport system permease subunit
MENSLVVLHLLQEFARAPLTFLNAARFSKKSPWSVFFRGEMSVICHKITVKCR